MRPGDDFALCIDARADAIVIERTIHVVLNVLLARPDHLHRSLYLLGNPHGTHRPVVLQAPAESATEQMIVNADLFPLQAGQFHDSRLRDTGNLGADPDVAAVFGDLHSAVHRLHRRVRQEGLLIYGLDLVRSLGHGRSGVAVMPRHRTGLLRRGRQAGQRCRPWRALRLDPHPTAEKRRRDLVWQPRYRWPLWRPHRRAGRPG
jgi:hypothetical protein